MECEPVRYEEGCEFTEIPQLDPRTIAQFKDWGYVGLRPSQANTFEAIYEKNNVIARDLTGTGKTLAFCLPLVERFWKEQKFGNK